MLWRVDPNAYPEHGQVLSRRTVVSASLGLAALALLSTCVGANPPAVAAQSGQPLLP